MGREEWRGPWKAENRTCAAAALGRGPKPGVRQQRGQRGDGQPVGGGSRWRQRSARQRRQVAQQRPLGRRQQIRQQRRRRVRLARRRAARIELGEVIFLNNKFFFLKW